jgi:ferric-dicitrate binding protein FerR (iron transport regulator)
LRIAAAILLILAIGVPSAYFGFIRNQGDHEVFSQIASSGMRTVDLPDGSRVFLNEGASIHYPDNFVHDRNIDLHGEAYFDVMSDPMNPFTVRSGKVMVSVLGTSFNVKTLNRSDEVEVFVQSGEVSMSVDRFNREITLKPGELGKTSRKELVREIQKDPNYLSWKTKEFKFVEAELTEVLLELEESYHVRIHSETAELSDMKITTSYSGQSIDAILETIGTAFGLTVSLREDGYYLSN